MTVAGQPVVNYSYDNGNRLTQIAQGTSTVSFGYDAANRRSTLTLPNGVVMSYSYDAGSQLIGVSYALGATTLGNLSYAYDNAGRRISVGGSFARTGLPLAVTTTAYNAANELTQWGTANLFYDPNGNMTSDGVNSFVWNARNQLASMNLGANSFQYDPFGRRVAKTISGSTTNYLYDRANVAQEVAGGVPTANLLSGGIDEVFTRTDAAGARSFLAGALGSTLALSDSAGAVQTSYTYEPFGNATISGSPTTNSFTYTGRELDGTGLYFYRARYYNPTLQRFLSEDPIGLRGGINRYSYGGNNPTSFTDPSGTSLCPIHYAETYAAFMHVFGNPVLADAAAWGVCAEDIGTQGPLVHDTSRHGMGGRKDNGNQQNPCQAYESTRDFVNTTDDPLAAIHAIQDSYAGGHQYQFWPGGHPSWNHITADSVYLPAAEAATEQYLQDARNGQVQDASAYLYPNPCH